MDTYYLYPTLFKVYQNTQVLNPLRIQTMKYFGWTRAATVSHPKSLFQDVSTTLNNTSGISFFYIVCVVSTFCLCIIVVIFFSKLDILHVIPRFMGKQV